MDARGGRWVIGALTLVLVGVLVGIGVLAGSRDTVDEDLTETQHEIAAAARAEALAFLTVDHAHMAPLVDAVLAGATGRFKKQYESQRETLTREAVRTRATSTAEVVALGVGGFTDDAGDVLIAANSTVSNTRTGRKGQVRYFRLRLSLVRKGDRWLTSNLEFVR